MVERKRRVMIACVTFETVKVSEPVGCYGTNVVYLLHHVVSPSPDNVYQQFYDRACELVSSEMKGVSIVDVDRNVSDFAELLSTVNTIIAEESAKHAEIFINLSAGSPEFTAAGATAAMMNPSVKAFFAHAGSYTVSAEDLRATYYRDGKPVGLTASVRDTEELPEFRLEMPDEILVKSLRRYGRLLEQGRVYYSEIVDVLREDGLWTRKSSGESNPNNDKVFFQRRYIDGWRERGWIEKSGPAYRLTDKGDLVIRILYPEVES